MVEVRGGEHLDQVCTEVWPVPQGDEVQAEQDVSLGAQDAH